MKTRSALPSLLLTLALAGCGGGSSSPAPAPAPTYRIGGTVTGSGAAGVQLLLSGASTATTVADASGAYRFPPVASGDYVVTPVSGGYLFTPPSRAVAVRASDVPLVDFVAAARSDLTISGTIAGGGGATVDVTGAATRSVTADASGAFLVTGLGPGDYVVTPARPGFLVIPSSAAVRLGDQATAALTFATAREDLLDPRLATPAAGSLATIPVVVIKYFPTVDGLHLDVARATDYSTLGAITLADLERNVDAYTVWGKFMLEEGSRFRGYQDPGAPPYLGYQVLRSWTVLDQVPRSARFSAGSVGGFRVAYPDFGQMALDFDFRRLVEEQGVKEIWVWFGQAAMPGWPSYDPAIHRPEHFVEFVESNMSSPVTGDVSNSYRTADLPVYARSYVVYTYNLRRTQAEMVHNHGHQLEAIYDHVATRQDGSPALFWGDFVGRPGGSLSLPPRGRAGDCHHPPNTTVDYDYTNPALVESDIEDWRPAGGARKPVGAATWGSLPYAWPAGPFPVPQRTESQWYVYWMQNMPGHGNAIPYGATTMSNWWEFTADWDGAIRAGRGLHR